MPSSCYQLARWLWISHKPHSFNIHSCCLPITRCIIQGSFIGPTSFIAYIADLQPLCSINIYSKYADDLTILNPASSPVSLSDEFNHVQQWADSNQMKINILKTKEIVFHRSNARRSDIPTQIDINIQQVDCVKLLAIFFTDNISFCPHVNALITALNQCFYLLGQLRRQELDMHGLQTVFKSIILSKILYACQSFSGFLSTTDIDRLQSYLPSQGTQMGIYHITHQITPTF